MRIRIENIPEGVEPEIVIRCNVLDESLQKLIHAVNNTCKKLAGYADAQMYLIEPSDIFYFEAVDKKVFIYCREKVYESKLKLYEIEEELKRSDFFRASKSVILNVTKIESLRVDLSARYLANLQNGEKIIISRQYVPALKDKLGLWEGRA